MNDASSKQDNRTIACIPEYHELWFRIQKVLKDAPRTSELCAMLEYDAGKELDSEEIAIMLRTAFAGAMLHRPLADRPIVTQRHLGEIATAIIDNEIVLANVIRRLGATEDVAKTPAKGMARPSRPWFGPNEKRELATQAKLFIRAFSEEVARPGESQALCRLNLYPFYNQTASGMFLAFKGTIPRQLWLPWGLCSLTTRANDPARVAAFLARLELKRALPNRANVSDLCGPVFGVLAFDGKRLAKPVQLTDHRQFNHTITAKDEWERLFKSV